MKNDLQHRMLQYQQEPSPKVWEALSARLDDDLSLGTRLYNYEQEPPAALWNNIEEALPAPGKGILVNISDRTKGLRRIVAAAIIIGIVAIAGILLYNQQNSTGTNEQLPAITSNTNNSDESADPGDQSKKGSVAKNGNNKQEKLGSTSDRNQKQETANNDRNGIAAVKDNRYLTMEDEEGKEVRLSKKAYSVFNCAENSIAARRKNCIESIKSMQETMASSIASPSADFAGLLEIIKTLEEKNN